MAEHLSHYTLGHPRTSVDSTQVSLGPGYIILLAIIA